MGYNGGPPFKSKDPLATQVDASGYSILMRRGRDNFGIQEHRLIVERVMGKELPEKSEVHHHSEIKSDNRNNNLVVCPDRAYHFLLHTRMRAKEACGDPAKRICKYCKRYDWVDHLYVDKYKWTSHYHRECKTVVDRIRKRSAKDKAL